MKLSTAGLLLFTAFFLLIATQGKVFAKDLRSPQPHEEFQECGTWCENTCANPQAEDDGCVLMCKRGYFCKSGYVREFKNGGCVRPSDCPQQQSTTVIPIVDDKQHSNS